MLAIPGTRDMFANMKSLPEVRVRHPHVAVLPDVLGGSPFVVGSRVPVRRLWTWHVGGATVETLVRRYPALGASRVMDALAFAYDNFDLIEADVERERDLVAALGRRDFTSLVQRPGLAKAHVAPLLP